MKIDTQLVVVQELRSFLSLAQLEGSRLEAEGNMGGAWRWYRALFRASRQIGRRATFIERLVRTQLHATATCQLSRWAAETRVDSVMLRRALDAAISDD